MSQRAVSEPFIPFDPIPPAGPQPAGAPVSPRGFRVVSKPEAGSAFAPLAAPDTPHAHAAAGAAGKPVVTLQRDGERVTAIRIECVCGQVIELACSY